MSDERPLKYAEVTALRAAADERLLRVKRDGLSSYLIRTTSGDLHRARYGVPEELERRGLVVLPSTEHTRSAMLAVTVTEAGSALLQSLDATTVLHLRTADGSSADVKLSKAQVDVIKAVATGEIHWMRGITIDDSGYHWKGSMQGARRPSVATVDGLKKRGLITNATEAIGQRFNRVFPLELTDLGVQVVAALSPAIDRGQDARTQAVAGRKDMAGADLRGAQFGRFDLSDIDLTGARLDRVRMIRTRLDNARLVGVTANKCKFVGVSFAGATIEDSTIAGSSFVGSNFRGATLVNVDLRNADLSDADLSGADLASTNLTGAKIAGVVFDVETRWPAEYAAEIEQTAEAIGEHLMIPVDLELTLGADLQHIELEGP